MPNIYLENHLEYCGLDTSHPDLLAEFGKEFCRLLDTRPTAFQDPIAAAPVRARRPTQVA